MAGPIAAAGAISNPTRYASLTMAAEEFTGLWTQRSPYRDAATAYLIKKFYQGSRFDSIWDGLNREITCRLTDQRRPGLTVYNPSTCPAIFSFYAWKYIQNHAEVLRVIADCQDGTICDVTAPGLTVLYTKSAGAGRARFVSVGTTLFFGDGVDEKKILRSSLTWTANTPFNAGAMIIDSNGNVQVVQVVTSANISLVAVGHNLLLPTNHYYLQVEFTTNVNWPSGTMITFAGVTNYTLINGQTLRVTTPFGVIVGGIGTGPNIATFNSLTTTNYVAAADTGTGTASGAALVPGTSGGSAPAWNAALGGTTTDGTLVWRNFGPPIYDWQPAAPVQAPSVTPNPANRQWQATTALSLWYSIIDANGDVQAIVKSTAGTFLTGGHVPAFNTVMGQVTTDGDVVWICGGRPTPWFPTTVFQNAACIIDSNGKLQMVTAGGGGTSGAGPITWATTVGTTTTDGPLTWTCLGPSVQLLTATRLYGFSYHGVDGSLSTSSPLKALNPIGSVLGTAGNYFATVSGPGTTDPQVDQIWIWATVQGGSVPLLLAQIPNVTIGTASDWSFLDTLPDTALNPFIQAPLADSADPPPDGFTGPCYHLQRIFGFAGNVVYYSGGPDTVTGNGNTAFPPLNNIAYPGRVIRLLPITVENGGILVFTTEGIYIILGLGTASNPFYSTMFCQKIVLGNYDALDVIGTEVFMMELTEKVSSLRIEYPFNPQSGYTEVGFPIGDQFQVVTTGGFNTHLFDSGTTYLSWVVMGTRDTAMFVADGHGHWFRMSAVSPPETGIIWSPIASIAGGSSCCQSVEFFPGAYNLLVGPATSGPILQRNAVNLNTWTDNGVPYASWDAKGVNILCSTGQWTEVAHIATKSAAVGARPIVSVLLGEIAPSTERPWNVLEVTGPDPPSTPRSKSVYSDRYALAQNGVADEGDCILTKFDYGAQAFGDELLDWGIYATTEDERKEEAQK